MGRIFRGGALRLAMTVLWAGCLMAGAGCGDSQQASCDSAHCGEAGALDSGVDSAPDAAADAGDDGAQDAGVEQQPDVSVTFVDGQANGWPQTMPPGVSGGFVLAPMNGVALADIDGKAGDEVISSSGTSIHAFSATGQPMPGWPVTITGTAQQPPSVGDVDGDGKNDVVQVGRGLQYSDTSYVHVLDGAGKPLSGWPKQFSNLINTAATLADLDGDGAMEIILQISQWPPAGTIRVFKGDGTPFGSNWNHALDSYALAPAAVGDLDGDGKLDVGYLTLSNVTVRGVDGNVRAGFPIKAPGGYKNDGSLVFANLDPTTAALELVWCDVQDITGTSLITRVWAADAAGKVLSGFPVIVSNSALGSAPVAVADIDGDGKLEIVATVKPNLVVVVSPSGALVGQPVKSLAQMHTGAKVVDMDGDGKLEVLVDNNSTDKAGVGYLEGYHFDGTTLLDFPLRPFGFTLADSGTLGDIDGNGSLELVLVSHRGFAPPVGAWVSMWTFGSAKPTRYDWPAFAHDMRRSNCVDCASASTP